MDEDDSNLATNGDYPAAAAVVNIHATADDGDDAAALRREVDALRHDRSEMQRRVEELVSEVEKSEVEKKALASHASYLEGVLSASQHDLATAESAAADSDADAAALRSSNSALESMIANLESEITDLESNIADLESKRNESAAIAAAREEEVLGIRRELDARKIKEDSLEEKLRESEMKSKNQSMQIIEIDGELKEKLRESEAKLKDLEKKNAELESKIAGYEEVMKNNPDAKVNGLDDVGGDTLAKESGLSLNPSWTATAAIAASSATVVFVATAFYLRAGQR